MKEGRNQAEVDKALAAITECVKTGKGNLLELAVEAAHVRATLGEISDACETIVGRYKAVIRTISGVYSSESKKDTDFAKACELTEEFAKKEGRRPRIMIARWDRTDTTVVQSSCNRLCRLWFRRRYGTVVPNSCRSCS